MIRLAAGKPTPIFDERLWLVQLSVQQQRERAHVSDAVDAVAADVAESWTRLREEAGPVVPHARLHAEEALRSLARIPDLKAGRRPGRLLKDVVVGEECSFAFGGQPPADNTALVFRAHARGRSLAMDNAGVVGGNNAGVVGGNEVFKDRETGSRWQQSSLEAISGPLKGERLELYPFLLTRRMAWRRCAARSFSSSKCARPSSSVFVREASRARCSPRKMMEQAEAPLIQRTA